MTFSALDIRIAQFVHLQTRKYNTTTKKYDYTSHRYQNYFVNLEKPYPAASNVLFAYAPFRVEGSIINLTGDNPVLQILFPNVDFSIQLLHNGDGNRLSQLELTTIWLDSNNNYSSTITTEYYIGLGSSINETTLELRFRSAIDSTSNNFPARTLTLENSGPLPLDSQLVLQ